MTTQGGTGGLVLGVRDQLSALMVHLEPAKYPFALIDILIVSIILYYTYLLIRETRAIRILYGIALLALVYLIAQYLQLLALLFMLQSIFAVILVAIPVVFQPELRAALERLGRTRLMGVSQSVVGDERTDLAQILAKTLTLLSKEKVGALIVIEQHDRLRELATTGIEIHAYVSVELLLSIFLNRGPLHDGAVVIRGNRVEFASALLPVAGDRFDFSIGTRHRAAIGITRETDAIAVVASEETGKISVAHDGKLTRNVRPATLGTHILELLNRTEPSGFFGIKNRVSFRGRRAA